MAEKDNIVNNQSDSEYVAMSQIPKGVVRKNSSGTQHPAHEQTSTDSATTDGGNRNDNTKPETNEHNKRKETDLLEHAHDLREFTTPEWHCCNRTINRQDFVGQVGSILVLLGMVAYLIYALYCYISPAINRTEFTRQTTVESMPIPYIYFEVDTTIHPDNFSCNFYIFDKLDTIERSIDYISSVNATVIEWDDDLDVSGDNEVANAKLGPYVDLDEWVIFRKYKNSANKRAMLIIPPSWATLHVANARTYFNNIEALEAGNVTLNNALEIFEQCGFDLDIDYNNITQEEYYEELAWDTIYNAILYYNIDSRAQLKTHFYNETVNETFNILQHSIDYILGGYMTTFGYEWFTFVNQVEPKKTQAEYFTSSIESTFDVLNWQTNQFAQTGLFDAFYLVLKPSTAGIKNTHYVKPGQDWTSVLSQLGGMYGTISGVIAVISLYLVWGASCGKYYWPGM